MWKSSRGAVFRINVPEQPGCGTVTESFVDKAQILQVVSSPAVGYRVMPCNVPQIRSTVVVEPDIIYNLCGFSAESKVIGAEGLLGHISL
jgi:hypothetical protein